MVFPARLTPANWNSISTVPLLSVAVITLEAVISLPSSSRTAFPVSWSIKVPVIVYSLPTWSPEYSTVSIILTESVAFATWSSVFESRAVVWILGNVTVWFSSSLSLCSAQNSPFTESSSKATTDFPARSEASKVNTTSCVPFFSTGVKSTVWVISSVSASTSLIYKVPVKV